MNFFDDCLGHHIVGAQLSFLLNDPFEESFGFLFDKRDTRQINYQVSAADLLGNRTPCALYFPYPGAGQSSLQNDGYRFRVLLNGDPENRRPPFCSDKISIIHAEVGARVARTQNRRSIKGLATGRSVSGICGGLVEGSNRSQGFDSEAARRRRGGKMPSRSILYRNVVRLSPRRAAAPFGPPITQWASSVRPGDRIFESLHDLSTFAGCLKLARCGEIAGCCNRPFHFGLPVSVPTMKDATLVVLMVQFRNSGWRSPRSRSC